MGHVWFTDCDSLYEHLISPSSKTVDNKRLSIDLQALRQVIWARNDESNEMVNSDSGDYPRWIDTSAMIADPLTKAMNASVLEKTLSTGIFDMRATPESLAIKERNRKLRQDAKRKMNDEDYMDIDDGS